MVLFNDDTQAIMQEIKRCNAFGKVSIALDFFDASINRITHGLPNKSGLESNSVFSAGTNTLASRGEKTVILATALLCWKNLRVALCSSMEQILSGKQCTRWYSLAG